MLKLLIELLSEFDKKGKLATNLLVFVETTSGSITADIAAVAEKLSVHLVFGKLQSTDEAKWLSLRVRGRIPEMTKSKELPKGMKSSWS